MRVEFFVVYDRKGHVRMVKRGPPQTKAGERFSKVVLEAPNELWAPQKPHTVSIKVDGATSVAPQAKVDLATVPGVCFGALVQAQGTKGPGNVVFRCTECGFATLWRKPEGPHWAVKKAVDA